MKVALFVCLFSIISSDTFSLEIVAEWKSLQFFNGRKYKYSPTSFEVYNDKIFIATPQWKNGVPASLGYIENDKNYPLEYPVVFPYPTTEAHSNKTGNREIISAIHIKKDNFDRLWVLDNGAVNIQNDDVKIQAGPPKILVYDLSTNLLLLQYAFPQNQWNDDSFFVNIAVDDVDKDNTYAYVADGNGALLVYSLKQRTSWKITDQSFEFDPKSSIITELSRLTYIHQRGLTSLSLSSPDNDGYSTLYYNPLASNDQFSISTRELHYNNATKNNFRNLGHREDMGQRAASAYDTKRDLLFFGLLAQHSIGCWKSKSRYYPENADIVAKDAVKFVYPSDMKIYDDDYLWILSNKQGSFLNDGLVITDVNFRIMRSKISNIIVKSKCDSGKQNEETTVKVWFMKSASVRIGIHFYLILMLFGFSRFS